MFAVAGDGPEAQGQAGKQPAGGNQPAGANGQPAAKQPAVEPNPLLTEPKTPVELFRAIRLMHQLARPKLARKYLKQLMDSKPDDKTLLQLRDRFGPSDFLRLAQAKELQPLSTELLKKVNAAFRKRGADPKYINGLLDMLEGRAADREVAITTLRNIGPIVLPRMIERVAASTVQKRLTTMQEALIDFGEPAVPALLAALQADSPRVQTTAISALGRIGDLRAVPHLWHFAFDPNLPPGIRMAARTALSRLLNTKVSDLQKAAPASISRELARLAEQHFRGEYNWDAGAEKKVELWSWTGSGAAGTVVAKQVTPRTASLYVGTRFAKQALELSPENRRFQALFLAMSLSAAADPTWEKTLPTGKGTAFDAALTAGADIMNRALELSLNSRDPNAAIAALLVLRQLATKNDVTKGKANSPIIAAMSYPDHRVQFAAVATLLNVDPDESFSGISRVVEILTRALNDGGGPKGLVVNTSVQKAATLAGLLGEMGYEPAVARTGRGGFRVATRSSDVALILLQLNTIRWPLSQTLANLRADSRTANIPIAIYGPGKFRSRVQSHLKRYSKVTYVTESTTRDNLALQIDPFLADIKTPPLTAKQRAEQRAAAAFWLAHLAEGKRARLYNLRPAENALVAATNDPKLAENAIQALVAISTKTAQQTLQRVVTNNTADIKLRRTAASLLAVHIQRFGLLLTDTQVGAVRQLHASAADAQLATALSAVMGTLKPDTKRIGKHLQDVPLPQLPEVN